MVCFLVWGWVLLGLGFLWVCILWPASIWSNGDRQLFAELLQAEGGNGEAEILEASSDAAPTEAIPSTEMPGVGLKRHEAG